MTNSPTSDPRTEDRSRRTTEAEEMSRDIERIRESYLTIRREELDRLDRIIAGWKGE